MTGSSKSTPAGVTAAAFRQHTSRTVDPQLHTHAVISSKVQDDTGKWLALDARFLKYQQRTIGWVYDAALRTELTARLGVGWIEHDDGVLDLACVPDRVRRRVLSTVRPGRRQVGRADRTVERRARRSRPRTVDDRSPRTNRRALLRGPPRPTVSTPLPFAANGTGRLAGSGSTRHGSRRTGIAQRALSIDRQGRMPRCRRGAASGERRVQLVAASRRSPPPRHPPTRHHRKHRRRPGGRDRPPGRDRRSPLRAARTRTSRHDPASAGRTTGDRTRHGPLLHHRRRARTGTGAAALGRSQHRPAATRTGPAGTRHRRQWLDTHHSSWSSDQPGPARPTAPPTPSPPFEHNDDR